MRHYTHPPFEVFQFVLIISSCCSELLNMYIDIIVFFSVRSTIKITELASGEAGRYKIKQKWTFLSRRVFSLLAGSLCVCVYLISLIH